jgi:hypothetical protein
MYNFDQEDIATIKQALVSLLELCHDNVVAGDERDQVTVDKCVKALKAMGEEVQFVD